MTEYYLFSFHQTCSAHTLHKYSCLVSLSVGMAYLQRPTRSKMGSLSPTTQGGKLRQREAHRKPGASLGVGQKRKMSGSGHHFSSIKSLREVCKSNLGTQLPSKPMRTGHLHPAIIFFSLKNLSTATKSSPKRHKHVQAEWKPKQLSQVPDEQHIDTEIFERCT